MVSHNLSFYKDWSSDDTRHILVITSWGVPLLMSLLYAYKGVLSIAYADKGVIFLISPLTCYKKQSMVGGFMLYFHRIFHQSISCN